MKISAFVVNLITKLCTVITKLCTVITNVKHLCTLQVTINIIYMQQLQIHKNHYNCRVIHEVTEEKKQSVY